MFCPYKQYRNDVTPIAKLIRSFNCGWFYGTLTEVLQRQRKDARVLQSQAFSSLTLALRRRDDLWRRKHLANGALVHLREARSRRLRWTFTERPSKDFSFWQPRVPSIYRFFLTCFSQRGSEADFEQEAHRSKLAAKPIEARSLSR